LENVEYFKPKKGQARVRAMAKKLEIVYKKTSELIPYENNPRKNSSGVVKVARSI